MLAPASRYTRLRSIASGGMGTVFLGRMEGAGGFERLVAIKVMHEHLAKNPDFVSMFLDEARLAASIRHPNVVSVLDIDAGADGLSLVMEYIDGPSLHKLMASYEDRGEKIPVEISLRIMIDALSGLHAAHELIGSDGQPAGLVHRDVSPQNILLGADGVARIADFGVARAEHRLAVTRDGEMKGKLAYMSMDQIRRGTVDRRSDVYAAGIVLWELLAGERLFGGDSAAAVMLAAASGPTQSPADVDERVPPAIDDVCMRALCKSPDDRWPTALAFAEALEDAAVSVGMRVARARDVAGVIVQMDEDGPTRLKPQGAEEWVARISRARAAATSSPPVEPAPPVIPPAPRIPAPRTPPPPARAPAPSSVPRAQAPAPRLPAPVARPPAPPPRVPAPAHRAQAPAPRAQAPAPRLPAPSPRAPLPAINESGVTIIKQSASDLVTPSPREELPTLPLAVEDEDATRPAEQSTMKLKLGDIVNEPTAELPTQKISASSLPVIAQARLASPTLALSELPLPPPSTRPPPASQPTPAPPSAGPPVSQMRRAPRGMLPALLLGAGIGLLVIAAFAWLVLR
jgi:eukaryotic-like serine/threonine-protein kinase